MKKAPLGGLLYRELLLCKGKLLTIAAVFCIAALMEILVLLSFRYGNLRLIPEELRDSIKLALIPTLELVPAILAGFFAFTAAECQKFDETVVWRRFLRSSPVSPQRTVLVKYIVLFGAFAGGLLLCLALEALLCALDGMEFTREKIAVVLAVMLLLLIFSILFQLLLLLLHTADKAGIALTVPMLLAFAALVIFAPSVLEENNVMDLFHAFCLKLFPFTPLITVLVFAGGYFGAAMLLKRREK